MFHLSLERWLLHTTPPQQFFDAGLVSQQFSRIIPESLITPEFLHMLHMIGWYRALCQSLPAVLSTASHAAAIQRGLLFAEIQSSGRYRSPAVIVSMTLQLVSSSDTTDHTIVYYLVRSPQYHHLYSRIFFIIELRLISYPWRHPRVTIYSALPHLFFMSGVEVPRQFFGRWHPTNSIAGVLLHTIRLILLYLEDLQPLVATEDLYIVDTASFPDVSLTSNGSEGFISKLFQVTMSAKHHLYQWSAENSSI